MKRLACRTAASARADDTPDMFARLGFDDERQTLLTLGVTSAVLTLVLTAPAFVLALAA